MMAGHHHIFQGGEFRQQMMELEDEADVTRLRKLRQFPVALAESDSGPRKNSSPPVEAVEGAEDLQEGGLAGARGPDDGGHLAGFDREVDPLQHGHRVSPAAIGLGDMPWPGKAGSLRQHLGGLDLRRPSRKGTGSRPG